MKKAIACLLMLTLLLCACTPEAKQTEAKEQPTEATGTETPTAELTEAPASEPTSEPEPELVEPESDYSECWRERPIPESFDLRSVDTDGDDVGDRCYVTPIRAQHPFGTCWGFASIGASGYEAEYRLKDTDQWTIVPFEAGQTELLIKGLAAGEYEVRVRAFVDTTGAEKNFLIMDLYYSEYSDLITVTVN